MGKAFACEPIFQAWDGENQQGESYSFGLHCEAFKFTYPYYFGNKPWPSDFIPSIKVHKDFVLRACDGSDMKGACIFLTGEVDNLANYRPTGINLNNKISSFEYEYQPNSEITIAAFYDAPNPELNAQDRFKELWSNAINAYNEIDRIKKIMANSGLNIRVRADFHEVKHSDAKTISEAKDALGVFTPLYRDAKQDHAYGIYFPSKSPAIDKGWLGITFGNPSMNDQEHGKFLDSWGVAIVLPNVPPFVGAHEWGHLAGLDHKKNEGFFRPYGTGHFGSFGSFPGARSFSSVMNGWLDSNGPHTIHLIFSSPEIHCNLQLTTNFGVQPSCGKTGESDARRALLETILQWYQ